MEISLCQTCKTAPAQLLCKCNNVYLCEQCIGNHIMQIFTVKHKPIKISSCESIELETFAFPLEFEGAIRSKLSNEILEIEEFRKLALQKVSELMQAAEKQLLETAEKVMVSISDICEIAHDDISNAISLLSYRSNTINYILEIFKTCTSIDEIRNIKIIHKSLEYTTFNIAELINSSLLFNVQITNQPSPIILNKTDIKLEKLILSPSRSDEIKINYDNKTEIANNESILTEISYSSLPVNRRTINNIELELIAKEISSNRISRAMSSRFSLIQSLASCVYYFVPNTNRIL